MRQVVWTSHGRLKITIGVLDNSAFAETPIVAALIVGQPTVPFLRRLIVSA